MANNNFRDFYNDDANVSPAERAKIEFEVELIGKLIEAREAQGLTQKQLAEAAGIKQSAVARLETLKATPQIDTLFSVAVCKNATQCVANSKSCTVCAKLRQTNSVQKHILFFPARRGLDCIFKAVCAFFVRTTSESQKFYRTA